MVGVFSRTYAGAAGECRLRCRAHRRVMQIHLHDHTGAGIHQNILYRQIRKNIHADVALYRGSGSVYNTA